MRPRLTVVAASAVVALACWLALVPVKAEQIHRNGFNGRHTALVRGDANVRVEETEHDISTLSFKSQPSSEHIKLTAEAATGDSAYINYYYETPKAPITELLSASVYVKATKGGIQLRARVVFPNEPDPVNPNAPLTSLVIGDTYTADKTRQWWPLKLQNVPELLAKHLPLLRTKTGRDINSTGAYIDRLVLNLYAGPGSLDVWVDDLDIGPVKSETKPDAGKAGAPGVSTKQSKGIDGQGRGRLVEQRGGQITVDGKPFLFRAIRHTGTPLHVLRAAGFDTLWLPPDAGEELVEDANREGWLVIPTIPLAPARASGETRETRERISADLTPMFQRYNGADILFYDLGGGRTIDQFPQVSRTSEVIRDQDPRRPRGVDVWDGFQAYSGSLDVIGAHRWPLFTNLDLTKYRDWLGQRNMLTSTSRATFWTWIQNHLPDWYIENILGQKSMDPFSDPIGPHPEQVRVMAHIALASGCRGLGFWSDRFLADSHHGRDRLQGMAILNSEIDMLSPVLLSAHASRTLWLDTNNKDIKAAYIRGDRGAVLLPIWFGPGMQFVPDQGTINDLKILVPHIYDGADPWRITPAGVSCLSHLTEKKAGGTEITIHEFDLVTPIVFTNDRAGLVVWWQDYARKYSQLAAKWALDLAAVEYWKVATIHNQLAAMGVKVEQADVLFKKTIRYHESARVHFSQELYDKAYEDATRALRPLRVIMRDHWKQATASLDTPTASPYAISFFTLPKHWELFGDVQHRRPGMNALPHGGFELNGLIPGDGVAVNKLPGWSARCGTIDRVDMAAGIVPAGGLVQKPEPRKQPEPVKGFYKPGRPIVAPDEGYADPTPELGRSVLRLQVRHQVQRDSSGKPREPNGAPLEKTFLAVDSPPVQFAPGTLVRVSGWVCVPKEIAGSVDGALLYDDACGEQLGVRVSAQPTWKQFHLYRRVPASGQISVTAALTGVGIAYFDDIRIEPLLLSDPPPASANYGNARR